MNRKHLLGKSISSVLILSAPVFADVTYWMHSSAYDQPQVKAAIEEAVPIYNKYGSFNKHLVVYYNTGVPTAQANYDGVITFGGSRHTRVALHEMGHTVGVGTYWGSPSYSSLMVGGVWQGYYARKLALEMESAYTDGLHGDGDHIWPWGLNYDSEDSFMDRIKHVRIMAALRCDMGIMAYNKEAEHQIVPIGRTAVFGVASPAAASYQWYKNGTALSNGGDITGANRSTLLITNVDLSDEGNYYCAAVGAGETLNSRARRLIIQKQVGQWTFDGHANDSAGSNHGTIFGTPVYTAGKINQAIVLNGTTNYVTLPVDVADAQDMTVAAWVYWGGGNQWQRIFDFGTSTSQNMFLTPRSGSNTLRFAIKNGGDEQQVNTTQLPVGVWVHLAVTLREHTATLYVNGKAAASNGGVTIRPVDFAPDKNYIGRSQWPDPLFNGRIDDFRIYNYALAGSEIWALWGQSANRAPAFAADPIDLPDGEVNFAYSGQTLADYSSDPDSDPLTYTKVSGPAWLSVAANGSLSGTPGTNNRGENSFVVRVSDPSGASDDVTINLSVSGSSDMHLEFEDTANDSAGSNHGAVSGNPAYADGVVGRAIDLDGADDYVTLPAGVMNTVDVTVAAWVNWKGGAVYDRIFDFGNNTTQYMFLTPNSASGTLRFAITASGNGTREQLLETARLTPDQWVHVAVSLKGDVGKLYVNGELQDINAAMTIDPADFSPAVNYIGKSQWPDPLFHGQIDDFRIYRHALSDTEIAALSLPPSFANDPIINVDGAELYSYSGQSLAAYTAAPQGTDALTFSKFSGPDWLVVDQDGTLSGIPSDSDVGTNVFTVCVTSPAGLSDTATMTINVGNTYTGTLGMTDLLGLGGQWLASDCTDLPLCGGADLDRDGHVGLSDFRALAHNWLADESLQLHFMFNEAQGNTAFDSSIYARTGVLYNQPLWSSGRAGGALTFDGTNDYVAVASYKGVTGSSSRTCSAWIKTTHISGDIVAWGNVENGRKWIIRVNETGSLRAEVQGGYIYGTSPLTDNTWHHVAVVLDSDGTPDIAEVLLYVDGQRETTADASGKPIYTAADHDITIGVFTNGNRFFNGQIDDVRIYDRALTEAEIQAMAAWPF